MLDWYYYNLPFALIWISNNWLVNRVITTKRTLRSRFSFFLLNSCSVNWKHIFILLSFWRINHRIWWTYSRLKDFNKSIDIEQTNDRHWDSNLRTRYVSLISRECHNRFEINWTRKVFCLFSPTFIHTHTLDETVKRERGRKGKRGGERERCA